jgi:predicted ATP-dependent endonuclease of OLD family
MQRNASKEILGENQKLFPILAIEEPEAHLHPNLQYSFLKFLSENCKTQVRQAFITTHSPNITAAVDLESIIVISKKNGIPICCYPSKVFALESKDDRISKNFIKRFLDVTKANIFFARKIIFIEGIAEELLLATFAEKLGQSLVDNNVTVVNVNGRYFQHFLKLFDPKRAGYLPCKVACITDKDPNRMDKRDAKARWKTCSPLLLNVDPDCFDYKACSNSLVNDKPDCGNIRIFSQDKGSTFEYEFIFNNSKETRFITSSIRNSEKIKTMMEANSLGEVIAVLDETNDHNHELIEAFKQSDISEQEKMQHLIADKFLSSISKGIYAQELEEFLTENEGNKDTLDYVLPAYLKNAIEWICNDDNS